MSLVNVFNEWDPVEEIIIGSPLYAGLPSKDNSFEAIERLNPANKHEQFKFGPFPEKIIKETEEDIQNFISVLKNLSIVVRRPTPIKFTGVFKTLDWQSNHFFCYCPRDIFLAIGNNIIEAPSPYRSRYFESFSYKDILIDYSRSGSKWFSAPKPRLLDNLYDTSTSPGSLLQNIEPVFEAANILRAGKDLFYLISDSGNEAGLMWLKTILGNKYNIHACFNLYSGVHIDSTISLLRPGLALVNPSRVNENNLPELLRQWEIINAPAMVDYNYSDLPSLSTQWLGMNLLMLSPHLAVVDQHQLPLIKLLESKGIEVIPMLLRHGRALGGGFHCITLDVRRRGHLESYFS